MPRLEPYPGTQAVRRAVALLKVFSDSQPEWGLSELARALGLHKTTAYRLLTALESEGMVMRGPQSDVYRLGPEAVALGGTALRSNDLRTAGHAELEALARATRETATLEVLMDGQVLILDEVISRYVVGNIQSLGTRWPAHATSTGKVLLAHLPPARRDRALRSGLVRLTDKTVTAAGLLRRELARVREQGYATAIEELEAGFIAVGAPVRNHEGNVVAAISLGGPSQRLTSERLPGLARLVREAGERVSYRLGFRKGIHEGTRRGTKEGTRRDTKEGARRDAKGGEV